MDTRIGDASRERPRRPVRNKRYSRRIYSDDRRPQKRLFTPEIKRFLKDWLVRRRENPYPNRDEKKALAMQTGLTYIQVCNWFANWRRKLKNVGKEPQRKTWGDLIKSYNSQVQGNVEHFSICSEDSIWGESVSNYGNDPTDHNYTNSEMENQYDLITSTTDNPFSQTKYKNHIMEKYLKDCHDSDKNTGKEPSMISRWLESAVNFKPNENNYLHWTLCRKEKKKGTAKNAYQMHGREELDAAEALTTLATSKTFKV